MLGIPDSGVLIAYVLSVLSAVLCIVFGFLKWNKGADE